MPASLPKHQTLSVDDMRLAAQAAASLSESGHIAVQEMPTVAAELLARILTEISLGHQVEVVTIPEEVTTNEAADYLNVSRPFLIKLLEEGKLPYRKVGSHRRIDFLALQKYRDRQKAESYRIMSELAAEAQELQMGY